MSANASCREGAGRRYRHWYSSMDVIWQLLGVVPLVEGAARPGTPLRILLGEHGDAGRYAFVADHGACPGDEMLRLVGRLATEGAALGLAGEPADQRQAVGD